MDFAATWEKIAFLIVHITIFELPFVLAVTVLAAYVLARTLDRHNARAREARLARRVALAYAAIFLVLYIGRFFVM